MQQVFGFSICASGSAHYQTIRPADQQTGTSPRTEKRSGLSRTYSGKQKVFRPQIGDTNDRNDVSSKRDHRTHNVLTHVRRCHQRIKTGNADTLQFDLSLSLAETRNRQYQTAIENVTDRRSTGFSEANLRKTR